MPDAARSRPVDSDRAGTPTVAARRCDHSRAVDDARCLQCGISPDLQLALSTYRKRRKASVMRVACAPLKASARGRLKRAESRSVGGGQEGAGFSGGAAA